MKEVFVGIARYMASHPECKNKTAYAIYNAYFSQNPYSLKSVKDVKMVVDYIINLKNTPAELLTDALKEA